MVERVPQLRHALGLHLWERQKHIQKSDEHGGVRSVLLTEFGAGEGGAGIGESHLQVTPVVDQQRIGERGQGQLLASLRLDEQVGGGGKLVQLRPQVGIGSNAIEPADYLRSLYEEIPRVFRAETE
jgi:hypothetical protein